MTDWFRLVGDAALLLGGFSFGRWMRELTKPRCPELRRVKAYVGWDDNRDRRMYKVVVARCELKDGHDGRPHDGPCLITKSVDNPVHWNPGDEEGYSPIPPPEVPPCER